MAVRTYLVVIDETPEARVALRFAARRAARTGGAVALLAHVPPAEFVQWGGVQQAMADEARLRIEAMIAEVAGTIAEEAGAEKADGETAGTAPEIVIDAGDPVAAVRAMLAGRDDIAALVLGAAAVDGPGRLVEHFAGPTVGRLPCPVMIVPGGLDDAALDRLS